MYLKPKLTAWKEVGTIVIENMQLHCSMKIYFITKFTIIRHKDVNSYFGLTTCRQDQEKINFNIKILGKMLATFTLCRL